MQRVHKNFRYGLKEKKLEEDIIFKETLEQYIKNFDSNTYRIWQYAFTEMVNNGIGIFRKISDYYKYETLDDSIISLFKGKLTTDKENHSGEGIFFTSRVMNCFGAISSNKFFLQEHMHEVLNDLDTGKKIIFWL